ncbi:MAG: DUF1592 domain-containing protein [Pirellulaceae bacterium]|nr:DUF1592 domain-containing protein [Pirellulaceae bacterium]
MEVTVFFCIIAVVVIKTIASTGALLRRKYSLMKILRITFLFVLAIACSILGVEADDDPLSLQRVRELGRMKSRFFKKNTTEKQTFQVVPKADLAHFQKSIEPILKKSCSGCHGPQKSEGRLQIAKLNPDLLTGPDVERWREIYNVLSNSEMPPEDETKYALADADRGNITNWLSEEINKASFVRRNNSRHSSFRRMTKYEYNYALQDLLGLAYPLAEKLPPEPVSEAGFKNSSGLLQMSAMQFEVYREIGLKALKRATVQSERPKPVTYIISMQEELAKATSKNKSKAFDKNDKNFSSQRNRQHLFNQETGQGIHYSGGTIKPREDAVAGQSPSVLPVVLSLPRSNELKLNLDRFLPDEGTMRVSIRASRSNLNANEYASLRLIFSAHTSNDARFSQVISERDIAVTTPPNQPGLIHFDIQLGDIQRNPFRKLATPFPRRDEFLSIRNISNASHQKDPLRVLIDYIEISAPFHQQWPPKTHTDIFINSQNKSDEKIYGREVLARFLNRAWRRPVTTQEIDTFMVLFAKYRPEFETFEEAMLEVLATALVTPEFLYLAQRIPPSDSKSPKTISDVELASRLSFFLWSSIPDEKLIRLAQEGKLKDPEVLNGQVKRMLTDSRSRRFSQKFVQQWLGLDGLNNVTHINDISLKEAMRNEPIALFDEILRNNGSVMDFIHSDYAVVNERLARHYRIPDVYGPHFRKVSITPQTNRGGILTNSAVLAMNSDGKDSHPLKRGVWMLERILGDPPPPPPADVPEVDLTDPNILKMTLKERIADHRNEPACISCHAKIDPWGIAFENYDALGAYRTRINNRPVDATSELFNKQILAGMDGLKRYLLVDRQDQFASNLVRKMTAYALGRTLSFSDHADIDSMIMQFRKRGDRLVDLINLIVSSKLFHAK